MSRPSSPGSPVSTRSAPVSPGVHSRASSPGSPGSPGSPMSRPVSPGSRARPSSPGTAGKLHIQALLGRTKSYIQLAQDGLLHQMGALLLKHGLHPGVTTDTGKLEVAVKMEAQPKGLMNKSLNMHPNYASHADTGVREMVQNWFDQCRAVAAGVTLFLHTLCHGDARCYVFSAGEQGAAVGYIVCNPITPPAAAATTTTTTTTEDETSPRWNIEVVNLATIVGTGIMTLGMSTKSDDDSSAGFFGEGLKVEINTLLNRGAKVQYFTGRRTWDFKYEKEGDVPVLHLVSQDHVRQASPSTHAFVLCGHGGCFNIENFLFLQHAFAHVSIPHNKERDFVACVSSLTGLRVLLEPQHEHKVFVHGILVTEHMELGPFGLDYNGPCQRDTMKKLNLGRDRAALKVDELVMMLPRLWMSEESPNSVKLMRTFVEKLYKCLEDPTIKAGTVKAAFEWFEYYSSNKNEPMFQRMGTAFSEVFLSKNPGCYPYSDPSQEKELKYLKRKPVKVSKVLETILHFNPKLMSLEQIRELFNAFLLTLPDPPLKKRQDKLFLDKLRRAITLLLEPDIDKDQIRFKLAPRGNRKTVMALQGKLEKRIYIVDLNLLRLALVHDVRKNEDGYTCEQKQPCGCIVLVLIESLCREIEACNSLVGKRVRRRMMDKMSRSYWEGQSTPEDKAMMAEGEAARKKQEETKKKKEAASVENGMEEKKQEDDTLAIEDNSKAEEKEDEPEAEPKEAEGEDLTPEREEDLDTDTSPAGIIKRILGAKGNCYRVLNVLRTATHAQIKKAYRKAALKIHPDKCSIEGGVQAFQDLANAFAALSKPVTRQKYNTESKAKTWKPQKVDPDVFFRSYVDPTFKPAKQPSDKSTSDKPPTSEKKKFTPSPPADNMPTPEFSRMDLRDLKQCATARNLDTRQCVEKQDLVLLLEHARSIGPWEAVTEAADTALRGGALHLSAQAAQGQCCMGQEQTLSPLAGHTLSQPVGEVPLFVSGGDEVAGQPSANLVAAFQTYLRFLQCRIFCSDLLWGICVNSTNGHDSFLHLLPPQTHALLFSLDTFSSMELQDPYHIVSFWYGQACHLLAHLQPRKGDEAASAYATRLHAAQAALSTAHLPVLMKEWFQQELATL